MRTEGLGTYILKSVEQTAIKTELLIAKGTVEVVPNSHFLVIVASIKKSRELVHKHMKLPELTERPITMVNMVGDLSTKTTGNSVNVVTIYNERVNEDKQFRLLQEVKTADETKEEDDWRDQLNFNPKYDEY